MEFWLLICSFSYMKNRLRCSLTSLKTIFLLFFFDFLKIVICAWPFGEFIIFNYFESTNFSGEMSFYGLGTAINDVHFFRHFWLLPFPFVHFCHTWSTSPLIKSEIPYRPPYSLLTHFPQNSIKQLCLCERKINATNSE